MKIGLFFGSFSPIHNGHLNLAKYMLSKYKFDEVWLVVSPNNPLKSPSQLWDEQWRLQLAMLATEDTEGLQVCDIEMTLPKPNYTVVTLRKLSQKYNKHQFTLIIGSDNMAIFHQWKNYEYILEHYPILVYPREGSDIESLRKTYPTMQVATDAPLFDVSSTQIRQLLKEGKSIRRYVPEKVAKAIEYDRHI